MNNLSLWQLAKRQFKRRYEPRSNQPIVVSRRLRMACKSTFILSAIAFINLSVFAVQPFDKFKNELLHESNPEKQDFMVNKYLENIVKESGGLPLIENKRHGKADIVFLYRESPTEPSPSSSVLVYGEFNGSSDVFGPQFFFFRDFFNDEAMTPIPISGYPTLFYRKITSIEDNARLNYKFILLPSFNFVFDNRNPEATPGGFGGDSVVKMPKYSSPKEFRYFDNIPHGTVYGANDVPLVPKSGSPYSDPTIDPDNVNRVLEAVSPKILPNSMLSMFINTPMQNEGYWVYLPPDYDPQRNKGYPVVYMPDGYDWISYSNINNIADYLISKKLIEPIILVMHDQQFCEDSNNGSFSNGAGGINCFGNSLNVDFDANPVNYNDVRFAENLVPSWVNPITHNSIEARYDFFNRLIDEIDSKYNTLASPDGRAMAGVSATGFSALVFALSYPDKVSKVITMSNAIEIAGNYCEIYNANVIATANSNPAVPPVYQLLCLTDGDENTRDSALPYLPNAPQVKVFTAWGAYEVPVYDLVDYNAGTQTVALTQNQDLLNQLIARGNDVRSVTPPPMGHSWGLWATEVGKGLQFLFPGSKHKHQE